jgi:hypothetical protein
LLSSSKKKSTVSRALGTGETRGAAVSRRTNICMTSVFMLTQGSESPRSPSRLLKGRHRTITLTDSDLGIACFFRQLPGSGGTKTKLRAGGGGTSVAQRWISNVLFVKCNRSIDRKEARTTCCLQWENSVCKSHAPSGATKCASPRFEAVFEAVASPVFKWFRPTRK